MHQDTQWPTDKCERYRLIAQQLASLVEDCRPISALSNAAALLYEALPNINWVGFYLMKADVLHLGPFQGKTACVQIPVGHGVCGTAAATQQPLLVKDVHAFPGHIACDPASRSEIVLPLIMDCALIGVMDLDAPMVARFDEADAKGLNMLCDILTQHVDWSHGLL